LKDEIPHKVTYQWLVFFYPFTNLISNLMILLYTFFLYCFGFFRLPFG
jgi:hypothetical protein